MTKLLPLIVGGALLLTSCASQWDYPTECERFSEGYSNCIQREKARRNGIPQ